MSWQVVTAFFCFLTAILFHLVIGYFEIIKINALTQWRVLNPRSKVPSLPELNTALVIMIWMRWFFLTLAAFLAFWSQLKL
jgi:hypothetical protein